MNAHTLDINVVTPTIPSTISPTFAMTSTPSDTFTATMTSTPTNSPVFSPTITPQFYTSISTDHPGNWAMGDIIDVTIAWRVTGTANPGDFFMLNSKNNGTEYSPAGILFNPIPAANIQNAYQPSLSWYVPDLTNPAGTYNYYYTVTSTGSGSFQLQSYINTSGGGIYGVSTDVVHVILTPTVTPTIYNSWLTPTITPAFISTITCNNQNDWMLGDTENITVNWSAAGILPCGGGGIQGVSKLSKGIQPDNHDGNCSVYLDSMNAPGFISVGSASNPGDGVIYNTSRPYLEWDLSHELNPSGTKTFSYTVTSIGTGYFQLQCFLSTLSSGPSGQPGTVYGLNADTIHRITTATPTITVSPTYFETPSFSYTVSWTSTPTFTVTASWTMTPTPFIPAPLTDSQRIYRVSIEYLNGSSDPAKIKPYFRLHNDDNVSIDLSKIKVRYWYTYEASGSPTESVLITSVEKVNASNGRDFTHIETAASGAISTIAVGDQNRAYDVTFESPAGMLNPGYYVDVQSQISKLDNTNYDQSNDWSAGTDTAHYSFTGVMTAYMTINGVERERYGQAPVDYQHYSVKVDCGGAGGGGYSQDRKYYSGGWGADADGSSSTVYNYSLPISGAGSDEYIYQSSVTGSASAPIKYTLDNIPDGNYEVIFKFAEIRPGIGAGQDLNTILINGQTVTAGVDVYTRAGGFATAYDLVLENVAVSCGQLKIKFQGCSLAGFEVNITEYLGIGTKRGPSPVICPQPPVPEDPCSSSASTPTVPPTPTMTVTPYWHSAMSIEHNPVVMGQIFKIGRASCRE